MNTNPILSVVPEPFVSQPDVRPSTTPPAPVAPIAPVPTTDASAISPAARFLNELSQLQQQNPGQSSQVLTQITDRLKQAAQEASNNRDSKQAGELNQLAALFQNAASGGQLPTLPQLQQAGLTGHHHHGGHHHGGGHANLLNAIQTQFSDANSQSVVTSILNPSTSTQGS